MDDPQTLSTHDAAARSAPVTLTASAYMQVRRDILSTELEPGKRITIQFLQKRYGIGPTPLREALARLAADGFVLGEDNRGFRVPPMSLAALRDIADQRKLIECEGLRKSIERGDDRFEANLVATYHRLSRLDDKRAKNEPGSFEAWEAQHREFHRALIAGAGSPWLARFQAILFDQADRYRRTYNKGGATSEKIVDDHKRILDATMNKDAELATLLLARHIDHVYWMAEASGILPAA